jgi:hypothetical protein
MKKNSHGEDRSVNERHNGANGHNAKCEKILKAREVGGNWSLIAIVDKRTKRDRWRSRSLNQFFFFFLNTRVDKLKWRIARVSAREQ